MTTPKGGYFIEPYARPQQLAPGTVERPPHIRPDDWFRMPWSARWKATRHTVTEPTWLTSAHSNHDSLRISIDTKDRRHIRHALGRPA